MMPSRICYTCSHCELRKDPPRRKRIVDIRADACGDYERKEGR